MRELVIPSSLREFFGDRQTHAELGLVLGGGTALAAGISILGADTLLGVDWWRGAIAVLLLWDVCCGSVANFTLGADRYYALRPKRRWLFLAVHWHLPLIALAVGAGVGFAVYAWAFAIVGGMAVNLLHGTRLQPPVAGLLLGAGLVGVVFAAFDGAAPAFVVAAGAVFLLKVLFAFAVTHFRGLPAEAAPPQSASADASSSSV
ncbi:hypothetical protein ACDF64_02660 [Agromyces sp. MMS24-JH15]|uniref:hypothetical protein n=1 Tax=Agromyces sp. MMS24-JH15 TaxID=3243765 RepID=UPI003748B2A6